MQTIPLAEYYPNIGPLLGDIHVLSRSDNDVLHFSTKRGSFILKSYQAGHREAIGWEHRLIQHIVTKRVFFSLPSPILNLQGGTWTDWNERLWVLYPYMEGEHLDYARDVELLGELTAIIHVLLRGSSIPDRPGHALFKNPIEYLHSLDIPISPSAEDFQLTDSSQTFELLSYWSAEVTRIQAFLQGPYRKLPTQICHNDLTSGNLLKKNNRVVAVLDFEFASRAPRALDIAMGLRMTMQTWKDAKPWEKVRSYGEAYTSTSSWKLSDEEILALPDLITLRSAMSIFLRLSQCSKSSNQSAILTAIEYLRNSSQWLDSNKNEFLDVVSASF